MRILSWATILLVAAESFAQATGQTPAQPSFGQLLGRMFPMFILVFAIFYFMVLRPQQQKLNAQKTLLSSLKPGEQVVTDSGIVGKVAGTKDDYVLLEIASNVKIKVEPLHIAKRLEKEAQA